MKQVETNKCKNQDFPLTTSSKIFMTSMRMFIIVGSVKSKYKSVIYDMITAKGKGDNFEKKIHLIMQ